MARYEQQSSHSHHCTPKYSTMTFHFNVIVTYLATDLTGVEVLFILLTYITLLNSHIAANSTDFSHRGVKWGPIFPQY